MKQTAVEWLAEKLEYVNWMRNRDEIFPEIADQWRKHYLEQAKEMEKEQMEDIYIGHNQYNDEYETFEEYYEETFKSE